MEKIDQKDETGKVIDTFLVLKKQVEQTETFSKNKLEEEKKKIEERLIKINSILNG
tara:strand:+ start:315 stop:482 length:168 start_codon:yes stop_codon:yes gene_type:complete